MSDELKSAVELALEKLEREESAPPQRLSDSQKEAIADIRSRFQARIAEAEISTQDKIRKLREQGAWQEGEKLQEELASERERLKRQMEQEVEKYRKESAES